MKVLCCGDREWRDWRAILRELVQLGSGTVVVEGECRGADVMCCSVARRLGYEVLPYPATWNKFGRAAGPLRNQQMLDENPDIELVLAFHADLTKSRGTANMVRKAREKGLEVKVVVS